MTDLGDRMKGYEDTFDYALPLRLPVILRVDGRAFHAYTKGLERPFDVRFMGAMNEVALRLCAEIDGAKLAYIQSDEISILLHNYQRLQTGAWFGNQVQKIVSVAASLAGVAMTLASESLFAAIKPACFDARVFVLPEAEVCNYFLWRQQDATRNSIQMLTRSLYSHREVFQKDMSDMQEMCFQKGHNWGLLPTNQRRGRCVLRLDRGGMRPEWAVDDEIPEFNLDRAFVERHLALAAPQQETPAP